jgi:hypothetical protein
MKSHLTVLPPVSFVIFRSRARRGADDRPAADRTPALLAGTKAPRHCLMSSAETTRRGTARNGMVKIRVERVWSVRHR